MQLAPERMPSAAATGLFGKIPAHGDFVRVRAADPAARALAVWLEQASEAAKRTGTAPGRREVRFVFSPPRAASALVGALTSSGDKVGRSFPLAAYAAVEASQAARAFPVLPVAARGFLDSAAALLAQAQALTPRELPALLDGLAWPGAGALELEEGAARERARGERASGVLARLFGEAGAGQEQYALHCLRTACLPLRGREPPQQGVALDCPAELDVDRWIWLELARRSLGWSSCPSFFWLEGPGPRLVLSLGAPAPGILAALWDPARRDSRIWPLTTAQPAALAAAARALGPALLDALRAPELSVWDFVATAGPR